MGDSERRAFNNDGMDPDWKPARGPEECRGSLLCNFEAKKLIETEKERDQLRSELDCLKLLFRRDVADLRTQLSNAKKEIEKLRANAAIEKELSGAKV